jgi:hypothetical protein
MQERRITFLLTLGQNEYECMSIVPSFVYWFAYIIACQMF